MSMRLRGASAADLEELGIDTEGMTKGVKSVVKQFKAMANIDIMEGTNYKTTFQILDELHDKWGELTDAERAALTEAVGGKRGGSVMSSLMTNWEDARAVVEKAENSQGSAMREQLNYAQSIQFSLDRLKASWQELQTDLLDSKAVKNIVDLLNQLVHLLDVLVKNPLLAGGLFSGIAGGIASKKFTEIIPIDFNGLKEAYQEALNFENVEDGIKSLDKLSGKEYEIATSSLKAGKSTEQFADAITDMSKKSKVATYALNAFKFAVISAITMVAVKMIFKVINAHKELADHIKSTNDKLLEGRNQLEQYEDRVKELYKVMNSNTSSIEDQIEARKELYNIQNSLVQQYGSEASNINLVTTSIEEQTESLKRLSELKESTQLYAAWRSELENGSQSSLGQSILDVFDNDTKAILKDFFNDAYRGAQLFDVPTDTILKAAFGDAKALEDLQGIVEGIKDSNNLIRNDYEKTMDALEEYSNYITTVSVTVDEDMNRIIEAYDNVKRNGDTFEISGNVEEVSETLVDIQSRLSHYPGYTKEWVSQLSEALSTTEGIKKELSEAYSFEMETRIVTGTNGEYDYRKQLEEAYNNYISSQVNGNPLEIQEALDNYINAVKEIENSDLELDMKNYILKPYINSVDIVTDKIINSIQAIDQKTKETAQQLGVSTNDIVIDLDSLEDPLDSLVHKLSTGDYSFTDVLAIKDSDINELYEQFKSAYKTNMPMDELFQLILENSPEVASKIGENSAEAFYDSFSSYYNASSDNPIFRKEDFEKWYKNQDWQAQLKLATYSAEEWERFATTYARSGKKVGSVIQEDLNTWERYKEGLDEAENRYGEVIYNYRKDFGEYFDNEAVPHTFGNINLDDRQIIEWTEESLEQNKSALRSLFEEARLDWDAFKEDMEGGISTVLGSVDTENFGIDIAYTPILQTENGPILLQDKTVHDYIQQLLFEATDDDGVWTTEELLELDAKGINRNGLEIKGLIADIGDTAVETSQKMHYIGTDGAWNLARKNVENFDTIFAKTDKHLLETGEDIVGLLERTDDKAAQTEKTSLALDEAVKETDKDVQKVMEKSTIATSVQNYTNNIKPWIDSLGNAYKSIFSSNGFDINVVDDAMLQDIKSQFNEIKKTFEENGLDSSVFDEQALEDFLAVLSNSTTTAEQAQTAFNKYATSLFYSADGLKDLNEQTANSIKQMLEQSGVTNYEEVVDYYLNLADAEEKAIEMGLDLTTITRDEIDALVESGEIAQATAEKLNILAIQKRVNNTENPIDTSEEVAALLALGSEAIKDEVILLNLKRVMDMFKQADAVATYSTSAADQIRQQAQNIIDEQVAKIQEQVNVGLELTIPDDSKGGSGADKEVDRLKEQMDVLKWLYDNDVIDYKHFLDQKKILLDRALAEGLIDYKRYFEEIHSWLREMLDLYNSAISYITKQLDKEIDKLEEERDARIEAIEAERDAALEAIDEEIKAQEEKIKLKEKEIKELQDANEERKREIDLQKKLYELERSRHQRVNLVYQEGADSKGQLVYKADERAISENQQAVDDAMFEKQVSILEKELDLLNEEKEKLDEQRQSIEEHYQKMIDETNKYYDEAIKGIQEYKKQWEELAELEEQVKMQVTLESLGISLEQILSMDQGTFEAFKQNYIGILGDIYRENGHMSDALKSQVGDYSSYMASMEPLFQRLEQINLENTDKALASVSEKFQTIMDNIAAMNPEEAVLGFESITRSANGVINAINGQGEASVEGESTDTNIVDSFDQAGDSINTTVDEKISPAMDNAKTKVHEVAQEINGADGSLMEQAQLISSEPFEITFNVKVNGAEQLQSLTGGKYSLTGTMADFGTNFTGKNNYEGTVGNAFANGYPGLDSPQYSALRSEYGQPELTVFPDGTYELTTTPTLSDLPKDTVIFNEEQTKRILKNSNANGLKGKSFANGTSYLPLQDVMPDKAELFAKFESNIQDNIEKMKNNIADMTSNVREITHSVTNNMVNNTGNTVNVGDINVTCPGVTEAEVAKNLGAAIRNELNGVVSGMALRANQLAMRR